MASEFAVDLAEKVLMESHAETVRHVDAELQEVRSVLDSLRQSHDCWCVATWKGAHDGRCQRARALMEKLEVRS
jgi:hypothetical protein